MRSAAKTNWRCDECNKYDRWDICRCWPHTKRQSPGSRCCSDLQPTTLPPLISRYSPLSHRRWALLGLHSPPAVHAEAPRNKPNIGSGWTSCATWLCMNHITTNKTSNDFYRSSSRQSWQTVITVTSAGRSAQGCRGGGEALLMCLLIKNG